MVPTQGSTSDAPNPYSGYYNTQGGSMYGYYPQQEQYYQPYNAQTQANYTYDTTPQQQQGGTGSGGNGGQGQGALIGPLIQTVFGIVEAGKANKERKKREKELEAAVAGIPEYKRSPYVAGMLAQAQAQANSQNPAISALYNQQQQIAANVASAGQNYASSGSEAIQAAIAGQQIANQNTPQIAAMQNQYDMQNRGALRSAQMASTAERQNEFNSQVMKNDAYQNLRAGQLKNATARWQGAWGNIIGGSTAVGNSSTKHMENMYGGGMGKK